jgi:hypothetical protein
MKSRLGLAVGARELRVVLVRSNAVVWYAAAPLPSMEALAGCFSQLVESAPRWSSRVRVNVVLSPTWVQTKPLPGLPKVKSQRIASQLVRENQRSFFLWKGTATVIPDVSLSRDGVAWGAAFELSAVEAVMRALRAKRLKPSRVVPALVAIAATIPNTVVAWSDSSDRFVIEGDAKGLQRAERVASDLYVEPFAVPSALAKLGADAPRFLAAYAAAIAPDRLSLSWQFQSDERRLRALRRVRATAAGILLSATIAFASFAPGLRASRFARAAERALSRERHMQTEVALTQGELGRTTQTLNRIESFRRERGRATFLLGALSRAIPESTAMLSFHVDSTEGGFTAIAPHVADVLPELAGVSDVIAPRIVGSVTRETFASVRVERATFRFLRVPPAKKTSRSAR